MNEKTRKLIGLGLLAVAMFVFLKDNNEIKQQGRLYDFHILVQTGRLLTDEFGFQIPVGDFNLLKNPGQAVELSNNEWRLRGNTIRRMDKSTVPWVAHVRWVPGSKEAILLRAKLDDDQFFPSATQSNLVFETNYKLNLPLPRLPN